MKNKRGAIGGLLGDRMRERYVGRRVAGVDGDGLDYVEATIRRLAEMEEDVEVDARIEKEVDVDVQQVLARQAEKPFSGDFENADDIAAFICKTEGWGGQGGIPNWEEKKEAARNFLEVFGESPWGEDNVVAAIDRYLNPKMPLFGRQASLSVSQAVEKANSLTEGSILSQESYHDILNQIDTRDRYPFTVALVEHEIRVASRIVEASSEDDYQHIIAELAQVEGYTPPDMVPSIARSGLMLGKSAQQVYDDITGAGTDERYAFYAVKDAYEGTGFIVSRDVAQMRQRAGGRTAQSEDVFFKGVADTGELIEMAQADSGLYVLILRDPDTGSVNGGQYAWTKSELDDALIGMGIESYTRDDGKVFKLAAVNTVDEIDGPSGGQMTQPSGYPAGEQSSDEAGAGKTTIRRHEGSRKNAQSLQPGDNVIVTDQAGNKWPGVFLGVDTTTYSIPRWRVKLDDGTLMSVDEYMVKKAGRRAQTESFWDVASPEQAAEMGRLVDDGDYREAWELLKAVSKGEKQGEIGQNLDDLTTEKWAANDDVLRTGEYNGVAFVTLDQLDSGKVPCRKREE